jgi:hypothetical protein
MITLASRNRPSWAKYGPMVKKKLCRVEFRNLRLPRALRGAGDYRETIIRPNLSSNSNATTIKRQPHPQHEACMWLNLGGYPLFSLPAGRLGPSAAKINPTLDLTFHKCFDFSRTKGELGSSSCSFSRIISLIKLGGFGMLPSKSEI